MDDFRNEPAEDEQRESFTSWFDRTLSTEQPFTLDADYEATRNLEMDEFAAEGNEANTTAHFPGTNAPGMGYYGISDAPSVPATHQTTIDYNQASQNTLFAPSSQLAFNTSANNTQLLPGVGALMTLHDDEGDLDAGHESYYQPRRKLIILNDDFEELNTHNTAYVRRVYTAITTTSSSMTRDQERAHHALCGKLGQLGDLADHHLADLSAMVVHAVYILHGQGDYLYDQKFKELKPKKADSTMTATERVGEICRLLFENKKHVKDILTGADAVALFVAAPLGAAALKEGYKKNNVQKADNMAALMKVGTVKKSKKGRKSKKAG